MALTLRGRLPGVVVETALPPRTENPLQLDVAAFIGFAERGPLHTPVRLDDLTQYHSVFGDDLPVARDQGRPVFAHLPRAVQAFFDNGGRRCYVVRVAGSSAAVNRFHIPGLARWVPGSGWQAVILDAAWVGGWSDAMNVGTELHLQPQRLSASATAFRSITDSDDPTTIVQIELDLLVPNRDTLRTGDVLQVAFDDPSSSLLFISVGEVIVTNARVVIDTLRYTAVTVQANASGVFAYARAVTPLPAVLPDTVERLGETGWEALPAPVDLLAADPPGYALGLDSSAVVRAGDLLRLGYTDRVLILPVIETAHLVDRLLVRGIDLRAEAALVDITTQPVQADLMVFDLHIHEGNTLAEVWSDLRFSSESWAGKLAVLPDESPPVAPDTVAGRSLRLRTPPIDPDDLFLPLGMAGFPVFDGALDAARLKEGLESFDPEDLFLDDRLMNEGARTLMREAEYFLYLDPVLSLPEGGTRVGALRGIHGLLPVEEIGLISIPDLGHRPWHIPPGPPVEEPPPDEPPAETPPDWSHFQNCLPPVPPVEPPVFWPDHAPCPPPFAFTPSGVDESRSIYRQLARLPELDSPMEYDTTSLLAVQVGMVNLCAARADVLAVLSLPHHFELRDVMDWQRDFTGTPQFRDGNPLSYAAVYHGWMQSREEITPELSPLRAVPPDGAVCGMIAARELARGVWVAPANVPLQGGVGLTSPLAEADLLTLFENGINGLRHQPGIFATLSAHTLSDDPLLLQVSVRRLMIFLRKLAWQRGQQYVFETNNVRFRQLVQASFERLLAALMARGALVAFEVVTTGSINTPDDLDNGRFLIELKVAPSNPVEFITVVLLRSGEGLLEVLER